MRLLLCLLAGPLLALTACTTSEDPPVPAAATVDDAALAEGLAAVYAGDNPDAEDEREGECFASALLGSTTPEELRAGGLLDASYAVVDSIPPLEEELAGPVADAQLACTDFVADATAAQVSISKGKLDARAYEACLNRELDDAAIRAGVVASLQGEWEDPALLRLSEGQASCAEQ